MTTTISLKVEAQAETSLQDIVTRNMRIAMAARNVKQKDLATALGVERSSISQKMTRRVNWSLEDIEKASGFFHVKPEALVAGQGFEPWTSGDTARGPRFKSMPRDLSRSAPRFILTA